MADSYNKNEKGKKRKKKRSHMQMAKKFARRRNHGTDVDSETYQYMVHIFELMRTGFPSMEEKLLFVNNVYEQSVGHEVEYSRNQLGSRMLESLLKYASFDAIQRLIDVFKSNMRPIISDRFASHVVQTLIIVCADRGNRVKDVPSEKKLEKVSGAEHEIPDATIDVTESQVKSYNDITIKLSKYIINNMEEFVWDAYANHLLRTVVECLSGLIQMPDDQNKKKQPLYNVKRREVIEEYKDLLKSMCERLNKWPQFLEFGQDELTSGLAQSVLYSLKDIDPKMTQIFIKKITQECFKPADDGQLSNIFHTESSCRLLETCLALANVKHFSFICTNYFSGKFKELCSMQNCNFTVQRLLDYCNSKEDYEKIFEEIIENFPNVLKMGYTGILVSVANACKRLQTKQGAYVNEIIKILGCEVSNEEQSRIVECICILKKQEELEALEKDNNANLPIHLHGSLIVQAILNFNKPIKIVNSLLSIDIQQLVNLISDPKGSHIVDAFIDSKYIGEKSRERLVKRLRGCWEQLARSTHGSRSLEKIWQLTRDKQRHLIMEELASAGESLRSNKSGNIISMKLNVPLYLRNKKDWSVSQGKEEKTRALFADIIG